MKKATHHNACYQNENRKDNPKEQFKFLSKINNIDSINGQIDVLDVGCATGEFLYFLNSVNSNLKYTGIDMMQSYIEKAKVSCPFADFHLQNIMMPGDTGITKKYDIIFAVGVMNVIDDFENFIKRLIGLMSSKSSINIMDMMNPEDIDVIVRSKKYNETQWEKGWNVFSVKSISAYLDQNYQDLKYEFTPWELDISLPKNEDDPYRAYTLDMANNKRLLVNGLQIVQRFHLLRIVNY